MLLNLSRYNFHHLVMGEHEDPADAHSKFLSAFILFIKESTDLFFTRESPTRQVELKWRF